MLGLTFNLSFLNLALLIAAAVDFYFASQLLSNYASFISLLFRPQAVNAALSSPVVSLDLLPEAGTAILVKALIAAAAALCFESERDKALVAALLSVMYARYLQGGCSVLMRARQREAGVVQAVSNEKAWVGILLLDAVMAALLTLAAASHWAYGSSAGGKSRTW